MRAGFDFEFIFEEFVCKTFIWIIWWAINFYFESQILYDVLNKEMITNFV